MAQKRKMELSVVDEIDKNLFCVFQSAANNVSQLYTLASSQQKIAFDAGKKHALVELCEWLDKKLQEGKAFAPADLRKHLQDEISNFANIAGLQEQWCNDFDKSSADGQRQSDHVLSSSASSAHCQENVQDMEVEINQEDAAFEVHQHLH